MQKIAFITTPDAEFGFSLGGIAQYVVDPPGAPALIRKITADPDTGLIVVDERLLAGAAVDRSAPGLAEEQIREVEQRWNGILLILPSPRRPPEKVEDYAARLIRRAIGYHVRVSV